DDPVPAGLFDEPADGAGTEALDWQSQSGSDLFADGRTAPEIDLDAERAKAEREETERVEPVDADLTPEQPSLSTAPSSIFSGNRPAPGSGSAESANVRIGAAEPPSDTVEADLADADVDFSDLDASDSASLKGYRPPAQPPAPAPKSPSKHSSADFELPVTP